jgi:hypothetical protein
MRVSPDRTEFFGARMAGHDIGDIDRYLAELRRFTMLDHAPEITCPTLIIEADHDFAGGGGQSLHDKLTAPSHCAEQDRELALELGGTFHELQGTSPAPALAAFVRARGASWVVVALRRSRLGKPARWSVGSRLRRLLPGVTVDEVDEADLVLQS